MASGQEGKVLTSLPGEVSPRGLISVGARGQSSVSKRVAMATMSSTEPTAGVLPSIGVGEGVGAGEGDSVSWSSMLRFLLSRDLAMTI